METGRRMAVVLALAVAACRAHVATIESAPTGRLPQPALVAVHDFAISPEQVQLDQGVSARLERMAEDTPLSVEEQQAAMGVQAALAETLAAQLASYGLPVRRVPIGAIPPPHTLVVQGQIVAESEGNRTRRTLIGLGAGKSSITADTQLYYVARAGTPPRFLVAYEGSSNSGRMPGAAETAGIGGLKSLAAVGGLHAAGEIHHHGNDGDAETLAMELAKRIGGYAAMQGWIPPDAVR